jgi:mannose-6-phosphate isomerase-like protein (cupin superfamily)
VIVSVPATRPNYAVGPDIYSIIMPGAATNGAYALIDMHIPPGGGPPPHAHDSEELFYVLEGEITVFSDAGRITAGPFTAVNIPGGAPHMFKNLGLVPTRLLAVVARAGLDAMFAEVGIPVATRLSPAPPPPTLTPEQQAVRSRELAAVAERYDAQVLPRTYFDQLLADPATMAAAESAAR